MLTAKLAHGLYYDATVVDYNLILKFLIIEDVNNTCSVVYTMQSPYMVISWQSADRKQTIFGCES